MEINECTRDNLCVDCDDDHCTLRGKKESDCPKWRCDMPKGTDCEHCEFINEFISEMRKRGKMKIDLKPCPFCGSQNVMAYYVDETGTEYAYEGETKVSPFIKCHGCDSEWFTDCYEAEDVLKAWNRRYRGADGN